MENKRTGNLGIKLSKEEIGTCDPSREEVSCHLYIHKASRGWVSKRRKIEGPAEAPIKTKHMILKVAVSDLFLSWKACALASGMYRSPERFPLMPSLTRKQTVYKFHFTSFYNKNNIIGFVRRNEARHPKWNSWKQNTVSREQLH